MTTDGTINGNETNSKPDQVVLEFPHIGRVLTRTDWELYDMEAAGLIAMVFNICLDRLFEQCKKDLEHNPLLSETKLARRTLEKMRALLEMFPQFGACDSEPDAVLVWEIKRFFGIDSFEVS